MILKKFTDEVTQELQSKLNDVAGPLTTTLHEQVGRYHHGVGVIQGIKVSASIIQDIWKKYVSGDRDEYSGAQEPLHPEMPIRANIKEAIKKSIGTDV